MEGEDGLNMSSITCSHWHAQGRDQQQRGGLERGRKNSREDVPLDHPDKCEHGILNGLVLLEIQVVD